MYIGSCPRLLYVALCTALLLWCCTAFCTALWGPGGPRNRQGEGRRTPSAPLLGIRPWYTYICSPANNISWSHKSPATVVALPEAKHISGLVTDTHSHFCDDIPDRTDWLDPTQLSNMYGIEWVVRQRYNARPSRKKQVFANSFLVSWTWTYLRFFLEKLILDACERWPD